MNFEKIRIIILSLLCVCCISYCRTSANAEELLNYSEEYVDLIQEGNYGNSSNVRKVEYYSLNDYTEVKNAIKDGLLDLDQSISIYNYKVSINDISKVYRDVVNDNPELFYVSGGYSYYYTTDGYVTSIIPAYISDSKDDILEMKDKFNAAVDRLKREINSDLSDIDTALEVHNYITSHAEYNTTGYNTGTLSNIDHSAYGVLVEHTGVCDSYSLAYQYIMKCIYNIDTVVVTSQPMNHAWNLIKINGNYYHVDLTWDDGTFTMNGKVIDYNVRYLYFLLSDDAISNMSKAHYGWEDIGIKCDSDYYDNMYLRNSYEAFYGIGGYYNGEWHSVGALYGEISTFNANTLEYKTYTKLGYDFGNNACRTYAIDRDVIYYASIGTNKIYICDYMGANNKLYKEVDYNIDALGFEDGYLNYCNKNNVYKTDIAKIRDDKPEYDTLDRILTLGSTGNDVVNVQNYLINLGYLKGTADGSYGNVTKAAVIMFQANESLGGNGNVDNDTYLRIQQTNKKFISLKKGSMGNSVAVMQSYLIKLGYLDISANGEFGTETEKALKRFQSVNGIISDGVAGTQTLGVLYGASPKNNTDLEVLDRTLKVGINGDDVKSVQQYLKDLGYLDSIVDGNYGNVTKVAAIMFQANEGLYVDGEIGNQSYKILQTTDKKFITLKKGMKNSAVKTMQKYLIKLGYLNESADGDFGTITENALRTFQIKNGITVDGIAGRETLKTLYGTSPKDNSYVDKLNRTLKLGMSGNDVKNVQQYLKNLGYMDVVDGQYGNKTKASAIMFQANEELAADGEIGNVSYKVMQLTTKKFTVLKKGVKSNAVKKMQTYLIKLGYLNSYADGDFGSVTEIAVKKFQKENGLYVDGIAGIQTLVTLYSK